MDKKLLSDEIHRKLLTGCDEIINNNNIGIVIILFDKEANIELSSTVSQNITKMLIKKAWNIANQITPDKLTYKDE